MSVKDTVPENFFVDWFDHHGREFPWREEGVSPFQLLVTEMLLRQTRAMQVSRMWKEFMGQYGTPEKLASADRNTLFKHVEELGFGNQRVQALTSAARHLLDHENGEVPNSEGDLMDIPHVGLYAAHAVLCFAHGQAVAVVDTNVLRLLCRLTGQQVNRLDIRREPWAWDAARELLPEPGKVQQHNYGVLDFTAAICKPRSPECEGCSLRERCAYGKRALAGGKVSQLP